MDLLVHLECVSNRICVAEIVNYSVTMIIKMVCEIMRVNCTQWRAPNHCHMHDSAAIIGRRQSIVTNLEYR